MKKSIRVALYFATFSDDQLNSFAILVGVCLKNNLLFPSLPVTLAALAALQANFQNAIVAAAQGGFAATAAKNEARDALIIALRQLASYVQTQAITLTVSQVATSGFDIVSQNTAQAPLFQPVLLALDNSIPAQLGVSLQPVVNARAYQVQTCIGSNPWQEGGIFPSSKGVMLTGLTSATTYLVRVRAIGGSTQYSPWSAPMPGMVT